MGKSTENILHTTSGYIIRPSLKNILVTHLTRRFTIMHCHFLLERQSEELLHHAVHIRLQVFWYAMIDRIQATNFSENFAYDARDALSIV
jgi:hypothetical protein